MNSEKALLDAILEAAVDAIILSDDKGRILRANPAAYRLFRYDDGALVGQSVDVLMPPPVAAEHQRYMQSHLETGENRIIGKGREVEGRRRDGTDFPLHLSVGGCLIDGRHVFVAILHDLTERKASQLALARSQRLDAVGQMTGGIAHDFNNLLTVIIGNLELMEARGLTDNTGTLVSDALGAAEMGAELTSRLMTFARRSDLKPVKSDLRQLCDDTLAILKRTLGADVTIRTHYAPNLSLVLIDPVQLQSALMNLALNARDAMDGSGEVLIAIEDVRIDDDYIAQEIDVAPGTYVRLSVSDDGTGMDGEAQKRAFEPFFTTKADNGGTGLGLATVYGFVRQSGGHITLYSEVGFGTSFGLYFPALSERSWDDGDTATSPETTMPFTAGKRVLVVEDNPKVRQLSVRRLQALGFETEKAETGDEALAMLEAGLLVDIVFSDLVMPGALSGYDLAERIARDFPTIKVLLTSGYASDVVARRKPPGRHYDILHKPFRQHEFVTRLQALLADDAGD